MKGRLRLINESHHPTDEVRQLARFALSEIDLTSTLVHFTRGGYGGRGGKLSRRFDKPVQETARAHGCEFVVHVRVPHVYSHLGVAMIYRGAPGRWVKVEHFRPPGGGVERQWEPAPEGAEFVGRWPIITHHDWREYIVGMTSHEGKHVEQVRERMGISEVAAEHFEAYTLRRYRDHVAS